MVIKSQHWQFFDEKRHHHDMMRDERARNDNRARAVRALGGPIARDDENVRRARAFLGV